MERIRRLLQILNKPHPFIFNVSSIFIPFAITFLVLLVFRPFDFAHYDFPKLLFWTTVFSLIPSLCVLVVVNLMRLLFPDFFDRENWTLGKEIILIFSVVCLIAFSVFCLFLWRTEPDDVLNLLQLVILRTVLISIFPVLILVLYEQYSFQKKQNKDARRINEELLLKQREAEKGTPGPENIRLLGENQKLALQLEPVSLVYLRSQGNYVDVYHLEGGKVVKTLVRNSLKDISEQLRSPLFFRCHRSFLISLMHVQSVSGNARNLEIALIGVSERIPVSRTKSKELITALEQYSDKAANSSLISDRSSQNG